MSKTATATNTRDDSKISPSVQRAADAMAPHIKFGDGGVSADISKDVVESLLPEGLTPQIVKQVDNYRSDLLSGAALALGEASVAAFKKQKALTQTQVQLTTNRDKITVVCDRERKFPNRMGGEGAPDIVRPGLINARYQVNSAGNRGEFKRVRDHVGNMASAARLSLNT